MRNFRELEVWRLGVEMVTVVYRLTDGFPAKEQFGLSAQIRSAAVSVPSNIAEGCSRRTQQDFGRFIEIAIGSSFELETQLDIARQIGYLTKEDVEAVFISLHLLQRKMQALRSSLKT